MGFSIIPRSPMTKKPIPILDLLQSLVNAYGPPGQEDEVRALCEKELKPIADEMWIDAAGNLIAKIEAVGPTSPPVRLMAHMDEISMIVKRINEDGSLRVNHLGGAYPGSFGQGPVDILGDTEFVSGVLSFGSMHTTKESSSTQKIMPKEFKGEGCAPFWDNVHITTRMTPEALEKAGVHPGTRVVIARSRRQLFTFQDCIASYFLDNRAAVAIAIETFRNIKKQKKRCKAMSTLSSHVLRKLEPMALAMLLDYFQETSHCDRRRSGSSRNQTVLNTEPMVIYQDGVSVYDKTVSDRLVSLGKKLKFHPQRAVFETYGSDAPIAHSRGQAARAALICFPVENTHGYEITHPESLNRCVDLLCAYLCNNQ